MHQACPIWVGVAHREMERVVHQCARMSPSMFFRIHMKQISRLRVLTGPRSVRSKDASGLSPWRKRGKGREGERERRSR